MNDFPDAKSLYTQCINSPKYEYSGLLKLIQALILQASEEGKFYFYINNRRGQLPREIFTFLTRIKGYKVYEYDKKKEEELGVTEHYYDYKISWEEI